MELVPPTAVDPGLKKDNSLPQLKVELESLQSQHAWRISETGEILHVYHAKTVENVYDLRRFFTSLSNFIQFQHSSMISGASAHRWIQWLMLEEPTGCHCGEAHHSGATLSVKKNMAQLWPLEKHRWLLYTPWNEIFEDTPDIYRLIKMYCTSGYLFQTSLSCMLHAKFPGTTSRTKLDLETSIRAFNVIQWFGMV